MHARTLLAAAGLCALLSCANPTGNPPTYSDNDLILATQFGAKTMCSCLFVMQRSQADCEIYARQEPAIAQYAIDTKNKAVASSALFLWSARAHYVSQEEGCLLE